MKKNFIIYASICILILGVLLLPFFNKQAGNEDKNMSMSGDTATETDIGTETEPTKATDIPKSSENDTVTEPMETDTAMVDTREENMVYVLYLEDEGVRNNPVFAAFIDKEITAYDAETEENRYIYECNEYFEYGYVPSEFGVHYTAEDLDGDGEDELLVFLQWNTDDGDLLVFHEKDGKLYQWETWENFFWHRMMEKKYYGNGIFSVAGGAGAIVGRYNAEGKIEYIVDYGTWWEQEEEEWITKNSLVVYKDGIEEKELVWEGSPYWGDESWEETTPENLAIKDECAAIMNEIWEELGEGRLINGLEWNEDAKKIPLDELLKSNKYDEDNRQMVGIGIGKADRRDKNRRST